SSKDQILIHSQLIVERKFLRHISDHFLDWFQVPHDVVAADPSGAFRRFQNSAQHPDHCRFPRPIWAEKTEDRSFSDGKRNVVNRGESAEPLRQPFHFDHWLAHRFTNHESTRMDTNS